MSDRLKALLDGDSLRIKLLLPFFLVGVFAAVCIMITHSAVATVEDEFLASYHARETLEAVEERLTAGRLASETVALIVAANPQLALAVQEGDERWIGRVLAPIMDLSGLEQVSVYEMGESSPIYSNGLHELSDRIRDEVSSTPHGSARSLVEAADGGLRVVTAVAIDSPGGSAGVLVTSRLVGAALLRGEEEGDNDVHLAIYSDGVLKSTTTKVPVLVDLLHRPGLARSSSQQINSMLSPADYYGTFLKIDQSPDTGLLVITATHHLKEASTIRFLVMSLLIAGMLATLLVTGRKVSANIVGQLKATIQVAEEMATGSYESRVSLGGINELNQLAVVINNLGSQLQDHVAKLSRQAFYDHLTGLPNRALFTDRLGHALKSSSRRNRMVAVLFLDLDNFKVINDSLGHRAGDQLLMAAAERLGDSLRAGDTIARLGGDEFTILIEDITSEVAATSTAERIQERLRAPFILEDREVFVSASIGIAIADHDKPGIDELLRNADLAMYRAKTSGKACYEVFDRSLNDRAMERLELEGDMRRAIDSGELRLHYQPIVSLDAETMTGVEALLRWHHPTRGLLLPGDFIPLAEETGLIIPMGRMVVREACSQARQWQLQFPMYPPLSVSVNISGRQFQDPGLVEDVAQALRESGLPPASLKLEITESVLMESNESTRSTLVRLKALGVQIAIDDFGTGYSSLAYLKHFPIDVLKIDRSFVKMIDQNAEDSAIVRTIVELAKTLGLVVTGEGIETKEQLADLQAVSCDEGQGYYFARPLSVDAMAAMLESSSRARNTNGVASKVANLN